MNKTLTSLFIAVMALFCMSANAQNQDLRHDFAEFTSIEATGDFEISVMYSTEYSCTVTVDANLAPYVQSYVKGKTLFLSLDKLPKEVKALYKGKDATKPTLRAVVSMSAIDGLVLSDNVILVGNASFDASDATYRLTDKAQIKALDIVGRNVTIEALKNSVAVVNTNCSGTVTINTDNKANVKANVSAATFIVNTKGDSQVASNCEIDNLQIIATKGTAVTASAVAKQVVTDLSGEAVVVLSGNGETLSVAGKNNSSLDAARFPVIISSVALANSSSVDVSVSDRLTVDLVGGSSLYFSGNPQVIVTRVLRSTIAPYSYKKQEK